MYDINQFRTLIVKPALESINAYSENAEELLIATCAQESLGGTYVQQTGNGPAQGAYQMEINTHNSLWTTFLPQKSGLPMMILKVCGYRMQPPAQTMMVNILYATIMARVFYLQFSTMIPDKDNLDDIWDYYKKYWNTAAGKATKDDFIKNYYKFTGKTKPKGKVS